ncbi:growth arrest-specific protein 1-like [Trichoplusia ni]|uniref:Growth arrest-specific protein 1-like n=1 Tax=Trichoplusia ni TaxID=7111 RepID=A0A7E5WPQ9_TRINI|nr:growth arrest-specific protein 1-like [Trichoplusia ni]XP_026742335.1 growth arrest-specific protein 1-like [Trichoplusia ni]
MWLAAAWLAAFAAVAGAMSCNEARTRCAYRTGCGAALGNYMMMCEEVLAESASPTSCPRECGNALIALTSTEEGKQLMNCECEDKYCLEAKQKIDVCRPLVLRGAANATSSCSLSQLICLADAQCATALEYYHRLCRSMFRGRKCSNKCLNSIEILRKQDKAAALTACTCDGNDYDCPRMQNNLARLCYHKMKNHTKNHDRHGERHKKPPAPVEEVPVSGANVAQLTSIVALMAATSVSFIT